MGASTLFSTIAEKSQNLSDVRSEASAVDLFSYYRGYSLMCENQQQKFKLKAILASMSCYPLPFC